MEKKQKQAMIMLLLVIIAVPAIYFGIQASVDDKIEDASIEITSLSITNVTGSAVEFTAEFEIDVEDEGMDVTFSVKEMALWYESMKLGDVSLDSSEISTSSNFHVSECVLVVENYTLYDRFLDDFIQQDMLNITMKGSVEFMGALESLGIKDLEKDLSINGLDGLEFQIDEMTLYDVEGDVLEFKVEMEFTLPSGLEMNLVCINAIIEQQGSEIGNANAINVILVSGANTIQLTAFITDGDGSMINDFIHGESLNFTTDASVTFDSSQDPYYICLLEDHDLNVIAADGLIPEIQSFELIDSSATELTFNLTTSFNNPSSFAINFSNPWVEIYYEGCYVGNASKDEGFFMITQGENLVSMNAHLGGNETAMVKILSAYIMGEENNFTLNITGLVKPSATSDGIEIESLMNITVEGLEDPLLDVNDLNLGLDLNVDFFGNSASATVKVNVSINNPMPFAITLNNFVGDILYDDDGYDFKILFTSYQGNVGLDNDMGSVDLSIDGSQIYPYIMSELSVVEESLTLHPTITFDQGCALLDESTSLGGPGYALMDIENGNLNVTIGGFNVVISGLVFANIQVPIDAAY